MKAPPVPPDAPALPSLAEVEAAAALIGPVVAPTPCCSWPLLNEAAGCEVWVKHENRAPVGAFKVRGGLVYLDELLRGVAEVSGVIAASTGNHGQSVAFAARRRGVRAFIVVPRGNNPEKNRAMRSLGAELIEHGGEFQEALEHSRDLARERGLHAVPSFHPWLVRGVATYALEMFRTTGEIDVVYVPIGLGSGACGVIAVREALGFKTRVIGVVSAQAPAYALSLGEGRPVVRASLTRVAEGVACSTPDALALAWLARHLGGIRTVEDADALAAIREMSGGAGQDPVEGAGALAWAAIRGDRESLRGLRVGCVLSGGNLSDDLRREAFGS